MKKLIACIALLLVLVACSQPAASPVVVTDAPVATDAPSVLSATDTLTPQLTQTQTSAPTQTPSPTKVPSKTFAPTLTRRPPTEVVLPTPGPTSIMPLRDLADQHGIELGAAVDVQALLDDETYRAVLGREFNLVVPENVMKFSYTEPEQGQFSFEQGDALVDFALQHNMRVRGHCLVWHNQLSNWVTDGTWTKEELSAVLKQHIQTVVGHYKGKVYAWDVVNEAVDANGEMRRTIWSEIIGPEYIELAFQWAHEADPDALLFYNDYDAEGMNTKSSAVYKLVKGLKDKGVSMDGVGLQMHVSTFFYPTISELQTNMQRLADLGLIIHITELDVRMYKPVNDQGYQVQAMAYRDILKACLSQDACKAVLTWGFTDKYSWVPYSFDDYDAALLFDAQYQPKPAYQEWLILLSEK